jgi:beta-galactosidase
VTGPARIVAVENGSITRHEPFIATERSAYDGRAIAILRATDAGTINVIAESDGLVGDELVMKVAAPAAVP